MLDSIKATLTRVLGPESAQVVGFYVDQHLALKDPEAFEQALSAFLGSQAGRLLVEAIKSDLRKENPKSRLPEPISRFLRKSPAPLQAHGVPNGSPGAPASGEAPKPTGAHQERFVRTATLATETGVPFKELITAALVTSQGVTCGYATIACLGSKALNDPGAFAEKAASIFGGEGTTMLNTLTVFLETKAKERQVTVS